jgi:hypothetical protein
VISSIPVLRAELHVSDIYRRISKPKFFTDITTPAKQSYSPNTGKIAQLDKKIFNKNVKIHLGVIRHFLFTKATMKFGEYII